MSEKALKQLVGALAVVVALWLIATLVSRAGDGSIEPAGDVASFFEGVDQSTVTSLRILRPQDTISLRLEQDGLWRVNGFRADSGSVARFFQTLEGAEVGDLMATNPANHGRMGVSADSARALELDVGGSVRSMLFGSEGPRPATLYAREPDADDVYLVEAALWNHLRRQLDDWRNRRMLALDTASVVRITVERDGNRYTVVRTDTTWTFEDGSPASTQPVRGLLGELGGGLVASRFVPDGDSLAALPAGGSTTAFDADGAVLAEVTIGSGEADRWGMVTGDSIRYRLPGFRVNTVAPPLESVRPSEPE